MQGSFLQVHVPAAWELTVGSAENTVAVLDSGVELSHPDLAGRLDGGWDFVDDDPVPQDETLTSHGTHVTGVIGAVGLDYQGIAGIDWTSRMLPLRVLDRDGAGNVADEVQAIEHAAASGARIANLSLSGDVFSVTERDALAAAEDTLFIVSAGNDRLDVDVTGRYPCALDLPNVVCVTAAGIDGSVPSFANTGARSVDLAAPGVSIISTIRGGIWASQSGTSMAAPHVTGAAALMAAQEPHARPEDLAKALLSTTRPLPAHAGRTVTGGLLDVAAAVTAVQATPKPPQPDSSTADPPRASHAGPARGHRPRRARRCSGDRRSVRPRRSEPRSRARQAQGAARAGARWAARADGNDRRTCTRVGADHLPGEQTHGPVAGTDRRRSGEGHVQASAPAAQSRWDGYRYPGRGQRWWRKPSCSDAPAADVAHQGL